MADIYLRGPKLKIMPLDYDDNQCETMILVNGKPMSIPEFRALKAARKKRNHIGMGIWVKKT
ncbi:MAG: hypothetical protein A2W23_07550 [Planctomycetes bacterium RBG_16_43_13]|nr:MAG: hypothetical protein A2W23_07550 [Planctomycetes bacterium RBG_16_43_13]